MSSAVLAFLGSLGLVIWSFPYLSIAYIPILILIMSLFPCSPVTSTILT